MTGTITDHPLVLGYWWYAQDIRHNVLATANDSTQNTAPVRSGQRQGFVVEVYNGTGVAQTITGDGSGPSIGFNNPGGTDEQVAVSQGPFTSHDPHSYRYAPTGVVPPGQSRLVRVTWISGTCLQKGESQGVTRLILRIRLGWFTRTEVIPLSNGFYLIGPSQDHCVA